jgi:hypothetical protein
MAAELSPKASVSADPEPEKPAAFTPRQSQSLLAALLVLTFYNGLLDRTRTCIRRQHDGQRCSLGIRRSRSFRPIGHRALSSLGGFVIGATVGGKLGTPLAAEQSAPVDP